METRKNRTPSARLLAAKLDEEVNGAVKVPSGKEDLLVPNDGTICSALTALAAQDITEHQNETPKAPNASIRREEEEEEDDHIERLTQVREQSQESGTADEQTGDDQIEEMIDVSGRYDPDKHGDMDIDVEGIKMEPSQMDHVGAEVTVESQKYTAQKTPHRSLNFTGETLTLKTSDLSIPNKAAHFLYFRCYEEEEVQKEFPLTIDVNRKGVQNFLIEPRVGLRNTDYYIDNYLWNRGKCTSSKKKIYVEVDGSHVKTSRKCVETAPYVLNWYYSTMGHRIAKKVCWLETCPDGVRASPVLVQYHVNFLSETPIEMRKTPKLYSDTRNVAQELLRSDSPLQTVQRFIETGETDPREVINKKQAYEMRRYVLSMNRRKFQRKKMDLLDVDAQHMYYDDPNDGDMYEETVYYDQQTPATGSSKEAMDAGRIANNAIKMVARKLETRISALLDAKLGYLAPKVGAIPSPILNNPEVQPQADQLVEWINALNSSSSDDVDIIIHNVVSSMKLKLEELVNTDGGGVVHEYMDAGTSHSGPPPAKRRHLDDLREMREEVVVHERKPDGFEAGHDYMFDGPDMQYEEVIAEEIEGEESAAENHGSSQEQRNGSSEHEHRPRHTQYYYPQDEASRDLSMNGSDVTVDQ